MDLYFSIQRCMIVINKNFLKMLSFTRLILILNFISLVYYLPFLWLYEIELTKDNGYIMKINNFGNSQFGRIIAITLTSIRLVILIVFIPSINIAMCFYLYKQMEGNPIHMNSKSNNIFIFLYRYIRNVLS